MCGVMAKYVSGRVPATLFDLISDLNASMGPRL